MKRITLLLIFGALAAVLISIAQPGKSAEMGDQQAMDILQNMARTLDEAQQFRVTVRSSYDAPQKNGQMIEFETVREIQVKRPDKLRIELQRSDGEQRILVFNGKEIIIYNITDNVYSRAEKTGTVDDVIKYLVNALRFPLPLARMFRTNFSAEVDSLVEEIDYVELNTLTDLPTDHLAIRSQDVDFQLWITQDKEPLPRRIVITYKNFKGEPQFRANFTDWSLGVKGAEVPFTLTPPKDAEQIPLLIPTRAKDSIPAQEGGAK